MTAQNLIVSAIVVACSVYALWMLMPSSARRFLAVRLVHLPLGPTLQSVFQRAAKPSAGCDCSGCDAMVDRRPKAQTKVIDTHVASDKD